VKSEKWKRTTEHTERHERETLIIWMSRVQVKNQMSREWMAEMNVPDTSNSPALTE